MLNPVAQSLMIATRNRPAAVARPSTADEPVLSRPLRLVGRMLSRAALLR